jgi:2-deoxy-D-gluconate 3-dehydrogenase
MQINELFNLSGKTALVTGCSRGIGESMAIALAEAGADIIGVSGTLRPGSDAEIAVKKAGKQFTPYAINLASRTEIYKSIKEINEAHPVIDILINNAGIILRNPAATHSDEDWDQVLSINLNASFILSREFGKRMLERNSGK